MKNFKAISFLAITLAITQLAGCGDLLQGHSRDPEFYQKVFSAKTSPKKVNLENEKMIYSEKYPMRLALFDDQKFFYQIDELGSGWGEWKMSDGMVTMFAPRKYFDMRLVLSGADETSDAQVLRFRDRGGIQAIKVSLRDPESAKAAGKTLPPLRPFTESKDGI